MNKMADWLLSHDPSQYGYTQICVARGNVSWGIEAVSENTEAAGELRLFYRESDNACCIYVSKTAAVDIGVCKVIDVSFLLVNFPTGFPASANHCRCIVAYSAI